MSDDSNIIKLPKGRGRPPFQWTPEIEDYIICKIVAGHSLRAIATQAESDFKGKQFPSLETLMVYVASNKDFSERYARAKDIQQDLMAETIIDIIDGRHPDFINAELGQRKESVEARKWIMGKLRRKKWGEVKVTEVTGADGAALIPPQTIDPRTLSPEAKAALYNALQLAIAQTDATDAQVTEEEDK